MGTQGIGTGLPGDLVLDAGALIALERGDQHVAGLLDRAVASKLRIFVPASALAQVWRGGSRSASLARLLEACEVDVLDETRAKEIGTRLAHRGRADIADAHVVCCAVPLRAAVATSDGGDLKALSAPGEWLTLIAV